MECFWASHVESASQPEFVSLCSTYFANESLIKKGGGSFLELHVWIAPSVFEIDPEP